MIFFSDFHWHDFGLLAKILIFLGFLGKINCQDLGKKSKKSKILARNEKNPRSWQEIQDHLRLSKMLARKPRRQTLGALKVKFNYEQSVCCTEGPITGYDEEANKSTRDASVVIEASR